MASKSYANMTKEEREAKSQELYEKYAKKDENPDDETVYVEIDGKMVPLTDDVDTTDILRQFDSSKDLKKWYQSYMRSLIDMIEITAGALKKNPNGFVQISDTSRECFNTVCESDMKADIRTKVLKKMGPTAEEMLDMATEEEIDAFYKVYEEACEKELAKGTLKFS